MQNKFGAGVIISASGVGLLIFSRQQEYVNSEGVLVECASIPLATFLIIAGAILLIVGLGKRKKSRGPVSE